MKRLLIGMVLGALIGGAGVKAHDRVSGQVFEFCSDAVVNCAGPWSRELATTFDRDVADLFRPSLAFNVLLDREPLSEAAVALEPKRPNAQVCFMLPWQGRILAGTVHAPWTRSVATPAPSDAQLEAFLADLNSVVPSLDVRESDVVRVYAGLLPAKHTGSDKLTMREVIYDHGQDGGPRGLVSLCGIKYTTARLVAERTLHTIGRHWRRLPYKAGTERKMPSRALDLTLSSQLFDGSIAGAGGELDRLVREEAVVNVNDLLLRRTDWGSDPHTYDAQERRVNELLPDLPRRASAHPRVGNRGKAKHGRLAGAAPGRDS